MNSAVENLVNLFGACRNGSGWKALCPAHEDRNPSLTISEGRDGCALVKCRAGCAIEDVLARVNLTAKDLYPANPLPGKAFREARAVMSAQPFDWQSSVTALSERDLHGLSTRRGFSPECCEWLNEQKLIGIYNRSVAFLVRDASGNVVGAHVRAKDAKGWFYHPKGISTTPFVIGKLVPGEPVH